jgi:hypothetical protein
MGKVHVVSNSMAAVSDMFDDTVIKEGLFPIPYAVWFLYMP